MMKAFQRFGKGLALLLLSGFGLVSATVAVGQEHHGSPHAPAGVLKLLRDGNAHFAQDAPVHPHEDARRRRETVRYGQHPKAVILTCADSRVAPELLFDQGLGDLFVIRVAGNVANEDETASIEYAAEHLHVPLVVVLGHTGCGAVTAVVNGTALPGSDFAHLAAPIRAAVNATRKAHPELHGDPLITAAIAENVRHARADLLKRSETLRHLAAKQRLRVVGAVYDLRTGRVRWQ